MTILPAVCFLAAMTPSAAPDPEVPKPSPRQMEWQKLEFSAFVHFGPNTFTDKEWGGGNEDPNLFNPTALDCGQWTKTFKAAGIKQVIITAKHHDGFCLWPTKYSTHTVAQSSWRDGKGDVLAELRKACNASKLKMGVYMSPWDRNHPKYGTPEYNQVFANMLKEVLTKYGPIYEVWFDGANGEGPNGKKQVYDWPLFIATVRKYAPKAVIFSDNGPDIRWVGNEDGIAGETCWSTIDRANTKSAIGAADQGYLNSGDPNGNDWVPAECDVSIRPGWFYHAAQDNQVKSPEKLLELWEKSVGRNGSLLLNVPPDRRGLIHENDVKALMGFRRLREQLVSNNIPQINLVGLAAIGGGPIDNDWNSLTTNLHFRNPTIVSHLILEEDISEGQSIRGFQIGVSDEQGNAIGAPLAQGTTIGAKRIVRFAPTKAKRLYIQYSSETQAARLKSAIAYGPAQ